MNQTNKNIQENKGDSSVERITTQRPVDPWARAAIWSAALAYGCIVMIGVTCLSAASIPLPATNIADEVMGITFIIFMILFFGAIILNLVSFLSGVIGLMRVIIRRGKFSGIGKVVTGLLLSFAFWLFIVPGLAATLTRLNVKRENKVHVSVSHLRELWTSLSEYSSRYDGRYPTPDKWCDLLVDYNPKMKEFLKPNKSVSQGNANRCVYAMNPNCEPNSPPDTVLLFETIIGGWNQFGGSESIDLDNHLCGGACILFNDGHNEFIRLNGIDRLKWKPDEPNNVRAEKTK